MNIASFIKLGKTQAYRQDSAIDESKKCLTRMMHLNILILSIKHTAALFLILLLNACSKDEQSTITVSAASSLRPALLSIEKRFETEYPFIDVHYNFGGSGSLTQQILNGAPVDVFISADNLNANRLLQNNRVAPPWPQMLLKNRLVLIAQKETLQASGLNALTDGNTRSIAIGNPKSVPAGTYAMEAFDHFDLTSKIASNCIYTKDVLQILTYVKNGHTDLGVVYLSDALSTDGIHILFEFPATAHRPIRYPVTVVNGTQTTEQAALFAQYLFNAENKPIFKNHGFEVIDNPIKNP